MKPAPISASIAVHLTERQTQIVKLICEDMSYKEIASRLGISVKTAQFHRMKLKKVLNVRGSAGITRYAIREHIIEP